MVGPEGWTFTVLIIVLDFFVLGCFATQTYDTDSSDSSKPGPLTLEEASLKHDVEQLRAEIAALKGYTAKRKPLKKKHEKNKFPVVSSSDTDGEETKDVKEKKSAHGGPSGTLSLKGKGRGKGKYNGEGVQAKRVLGSKLSPQKISIKKAGISTAKTVPQCSETKHKPTVRLNVRKPPKMRKLDAKPEEHSSSEDFQVTPSKPTKASHKPNTVTEAAAQGSPYECDVNVLGGASQEQSSKLSVTILDDELNIVRMDGGKKLLEDVPYYHLVVDVLESAGKAYFFPPLNNLKPYAYQGKIGIGRPHPLREDTTMTEIKLSQRHRKVGRQNLSIVGKSHLKAAEIMDRFQVKQAQNKYNPQASTSNKRKGALPSTPYIRLYSSDESAYDPEDDWYAGIEGADDTVIAGNLWQEDRNSSPVIPMSQNNEQAQEKQREYLDTFQRVSDVLMQDEPAKENQTTQTESVSMTPAVTADTPIAEDVRKTLELCQSMNDRLDTLDYVAGNNDALVRAVEDLRNKFRQVKLDVASIKSGMVAKIKEKSVPKNDRLYVSTGTVTDGALSQDISTQTELGAAATKDKNGVQAVKQPDKGGAEDVLHAQSVKDEFSYHEIVWPRIYINGVRHRRSTTLKPQGGDHVEQLIIQLTAFRKNLTLDIRLNKELFARTYIEKHFKDGQAIVNKPQGLGRAACHYHGTVREREDTVVALSTCEGLRGLISTEEEEIYIEPTKASLHGAHIITRHSDMLQKNLTCGFDLHDHHRIEIPSIHKQKLHSRLRRSVHWPYDSTEKTRIVELYIANDHRQHLNYGSSVQKVIQRTQEIVNIVSSLYRPLNIYVALVGIEIWTDRDKSTIDENADTTMNNFLEYRTVHICPLHKNDNAQLITGSVFSDGVVGKAVKSTICSFQYSGGVNMDHSKFVGPVATTVAHEMGHNFGMQHDVHTCTCPDDRCIMAASSGGKNPTKWSSCSIEELSDAFFQGLDYCLKDLPDQLYGIGTCGNGFLEAGEQCDCGLPQDCDNKCCNATTCQLLPNATCGTGACCDLYSCQVKRASTECRKSSGECDLAEYCNGESEFCPHDVHVQNGKSCKGNTAFCFNGACPSHDGQCKKLWGSTGKNAHRECYNHFNRMGLANGHCGFNWREKTFTRCAEEDVMCGMLHCEHRNEKLMFWKEALAYTMPEAWIKEGNTKYDCKGAILDVGLDMPDPGMTPDGSKCGDEKMCVNQHCRLIQEHDILQCPDCNGHGTCNTLGQCHCDRGYKPPYCNKQGNGGSEHSGPVSIDNGSAGTVAAIVIVFFLLLGGGVLLAYLAFRNWQTIKKFWDGRRPYKYESRYCSSFIHRAKRSEPAVNPPASVNKRIPNRAAPAVPPPTAIVQPKPVLAKRPRPQSFRDVPISAPRLESTTKSVEDSTMKSVGPRARPLPPIPAEGDPETRAPPGVPSKSTPNALPIAQVQPQPHQSVHQPSVPDKTEVAEEKGTHPRPKRPPPPKRTQSFQEGQTLPPPPSYPPPREPGFSTVGHKPKKPTPKLSQGGGGEGTTGRPQNNWRVSWQPPSQKFSVAQPNGDINTKEGSTAQPSKVTEKNHNEPSVAFSSLKNRFENESSDEPVTVSKPKVQRSVSMKGIKPPPPPKPPSLEKQDSSEC